MDNVKISLDGQFELTDLRARIDSNVVMLPIASEIKYIYEDGLSFGYPIDFGWVTNVDYQPVFGALADDVIALSQVIKDLPRCFPPSAGAMPIDTFDFSEKELDSWKEKFDMQSWAEKKYEEEVLEFGVDEAKEDWIEDIKDNYWKWTDEMREACDSHEMSLNTPKNVLTKILTNDSLELYSDANKDFFFKTPFHENGKLKKADKKDALNYIRDFQDYTKHANNKSKLVEEINHSLNLLKSTL